MPAPVLSPLGAPPTRANPSQFAARADAFMTQLPTLVTQINALVNYWNAELDVSSFLGTNGGTVSGPVIFNSPPSIFAAATSGEQALLTLGKGTTQRQQLRMANDGSLNLVPLGGGLAQLRINNQPVYHGGNRPTPADIGALPASAYTAEDVLAKLQQVSGGSGSTVDAGSLAGQPGSFYRNASNMNAGTLPDARLSSGIARTATNMVAGDGLTGGGTLAASRTFSVDATVARRNAQNIFTQPQLFQGGSIYVESGPTSNAHLWFRTIGGALRALIWAAPSTSMMRYRSYTADGSTYREFSHDGDSGVLTSAEFNGGASRLTNLNASAVDRGTLPDARLSGGIARSAVNMVAGDGLSGGGTLAASRTFSVDSSVVRTSRSITAGNGLSGGGTLAANRTISLGTPGSITADSTNSVTTASHTHSITRETIGELYSRIGVGGQYTHAFLARYDWGGIMNPGDLVAGSQLRYAGLTHTGSFTTLNFAGSPGGTWQCLGRLASSQGNFSAATLFRRMT